MMPSLIGGPPVQRTAGRLSDSTGSSSPMGDRGSQVGLDTVGLLQALLEQRPYERAVLGAAGGGEVGLQPGRQLLVGGQGGLVDQGLDAGHGHPVEAGDAAGEAV